MRAAVTFRAGEPVVTITEGSLCGITTPATIAVVPDGLLVTSKPLVKSEQLDRTLECLGDQRKLITGRYYTVPRPQDPFSKGNQLIDYFEFDWKQKKYIPNVL